MINELDHKVTQDFPLANLAILTRGHLYFVEDENLRFLLSTTNLSVDTSVTTQTSSCSIGALYIG